MGGIPLDKILMIVLGGVKVLKIVDFRDNGALEHALSLQLLDIGLGRPLLLRGGGENSRAILAPDIHPLTVYLGGIMTGTEENFQELPIAHLTGIVGNGDGFRMIRGAATNPRVIGGLGLAAAIASPQKQPPEKTAVC
jgi:hypothetical protein